MTAAQESFGRWPGTHAASAFAWRSWREWECSCSLLLLRALRRRLPSCRARVRRHQRADGGRCAWCDECVGGWLPAVGSRPYVHARRAVGRYELERCPERQSILGYESVARRGQRPRHPPDVGGRRRVQRAAVFGAGRALGRQLLASRRGPVSAWHAVGIVQRVGAFTHGCWAVGDYTDGSVKTLVEHWDGTSWSIIPSVDPSSQTNILTSVSAISDSDVWAVGTYRDDVSNTVRPLVEHWDGTSWRGVATPTISSHAAGFFSVAKAGSHVWAVGNKFSTSTTSKRTLIERFSAGKWKVVKSPNVGSSDNTLVGFVAVPGGAWAVGNYSPTRTSPNLYTLALKWDGIAGRSFPARAQASLTSCSALAHSKATSGQSAIMWTAQPRLWSNAAKADGKPSGRIHGSAPSPGSTRKRAVNAQHSVPHVHRGRGHLRPNKHPCRARGDLGVETPTAGLAYR